MQSNQPASFFAASAYPLKAIPEETTSKRKPNLTPYLQALLEGQSRSASKARVFPMVDPYPKGTEFTSETKARHPFLKS
ncbi:MAG: hypothetical protein EOO05_07455 [Chitinophagaceae bacterium]|nr:MAG: hypothetical protein EOO05_07455 [Chitinophagaceae bacterium]